VIAGGGVAALEGLLALRELAEERVEIDLITPNSEFEYRPMELAALFRDQRIQRYDLARIAADQGATLVGDRLEGVWPEKRAVTQSGAVVSYDSLLIAVGTRLRVGVPGAITVAAPGFRQEFGRAIQDLESGLARRMAFVAPAGIGWLLPLYELALLTADRLAAVGARAELLVATPEDAPLEVFGAEASTEVGELLAGRGIELLTGQRPVRVDANGLVATPSERIDVDRVVALPAMSGPAIRGVRQTTTGFIPTDTHARVLDAPGIYAAGDGTAYPVKQGGLAAQQADVVAAVLAARAGADVELPPTRRILRSRLLGAERPLYLRAELDAEGRPLPSGDSSTVTEEAAGSPAAKLVARHLSPWMAGSAGRLVPASGKLQ
jgi:sulfide:quinone oxidoreductase